MRVDVDYLRQHYASLSDEALRAINRADLVGEAQRLYDEELAQREPESLRGPIPEVVNRKVRPVAGPVGEPDDATPGWLEGAVAVTTFAAFPGGHAATDAEEARDVLKAAGIPVHVDAERESENQQPEYRILVPGALSLEAASILDCEIFNLQMESDWRVHFEALSDQELRALDPEVICAGLLDRAARLRKAYEDEREQRGI